MQLDPFFVLGGFRLILSIRKIYGWLDWTNKMKYPGSVYKKKPNPNWEYIADYYLYYIVYLF